MKIYQTTIQHFFVSNGTDYASALHPVSDIDLRSSYYQAMARHNALVQGVAERCRHTIRCKKDGMQNLITMLQTEKNGRYVIQTIEKEI